MIVLVRCEKLNSERLNSLYHEKTCVFLSLCALSRKSMCVFTLLNHVIQICRLKGRIDQFINDLTT